MQIAYEEGEYECGNYLKTVESMSVIFYFLYLLSVCCAFVTSFDIASLGNSGVNCALGPSKSICYYNSGDFVIAGSSL